MADPTNNTRFREVAEGLTVEMIATRIELDYTPAGADSRHAIRCANATTVLTVADPVTGQEVSLSAAGWVTWAKAFYDHAHNAVNTPEPLEPEEEVEMEP